jgi:hypothetical protein
MTLTPTNTANDQADGDGDHMDLFALAPPGIT